MIEGRLGTAYVLAAALSILLLSQCPQAETHWLQLFKGEIIAVSNPDVGITLLAFTAVTGLLVAFHQEFLLESHDRDMAVSLGKAVGLWDLALYLLIGLTIAIAVLSVGPLVAFGFLVIPPLIVRRFARTMRQSAIGVLTALGGFCLAYRRDLPVGPTDVTPLGALYAVSFVLRKIPGRWRTAPAT